LSSSSSESDISSESSAAYLTAYVFPNTDFNGIYREVGTYGGKTLHQNANGCLLGWHIWSGLGSPTGVAEQWVLAQNDIIVYAGDNADPTVGTWAALTSEPVVGNFVGPLMSSSSSSSSLSSYAAVIMEVSSSSSSSVIKQLQLTQALNAYRFGGWRYNTKDLQDIRTGGFGGRV